MKLVELHEPKDPEHDGYRVSHEREVEYDAHSKPENAKLYHSIHTPDGKVHNIDHSPYERIDQPTLKHYVNFHKQHGRFPNRKDIKSLGPLDSKSVKNLVGSAERTTA